MKIGQAAVVLYNLIKRFGSENGNTLPCSPDILKFIGFYRFNFCRLKVSSGHLCLLLAL